MLAVPVSDRKGPFLVPADRVASALPPNRTRCDDTAAESSAARPRRDDAGRRGAGRRVGADRLERHQRAHGPRRLRDDRARRPGDRGSRVSPESERPIAPEGQDRHRGPRASRCSPPSTTASSPNGSRGDSPRGACAWSPRTRAGRSPPRRSRSPPRHLETYDGFILAVAASESADLNRILATKPIVLLGERALSTRFDHVLMDNVGGGRIATTHLLERGARSIVILGGSSAEGESVQTLRTRGYVEAHRDLGAAGRRDADRARRARLVDGYRAMVALLDRGTVFDARLRPHRFLRFGRDARACRSAALGIPDDVQVIGFDNVRASRFSHAVASPRSSRATTRWRTRSSRS